MANPPGTSYGSCSLFTSSLWRQHLLSLGVRPYATTSHPPNGIAEQAVGQTKQILRTLSRKPDWSSEISNIQNAINSWLSRTLGASPYYILFGQGPPFPLHQQVLGAENQGQAQEHSSLQRMRGILQQGEAKACQNGSTRRGIYGGGAIIFSLVDEFLVA